MNQLATLGNAQLPAHIQGDSAQATGLVTSESVPRISLRDASFLLKKDGNEIRVGLGKPLHVVILGIDPPEAKRTAKQWYAGGWSEDSADSPDCLSNDGVTPDQSIAEPQSSNCAQCPKNAWGSGKDADGNPSKGKACSDRKNLLVVLSGKHIDGDVFRLSVPPTSLKALSSFGRDLVRYNVNMHKIVTQIDVDPDNSKGMMFGYAGYLDEQESNRMAARAAGAELQEMVHHSLPAPTAEHAMAEPKPAVIEEVDLDGFGAAEAVSPAVEAQIQQQVVTQQVVVEPQVTATVAVGTAAELDDNGRPWDARIDSAGKTKNADGTWRIKRGVSKELVAEVIASYTEPAVGEVVQQEAAPTSDADDLDDLLSNWGSNT